MLTAFLLHISIELKIRQMFTRFSLCCRDSLREQVIKQTLTKISSQTPLKGRVEHALSENLQFMTLSKSKFYRTEQMKNTEHCLEQKLRLSW